MKLLIDIGNRRLKWAVAGDGDDDSGSDFIASGAFAHANAADLAAHFNPLAPPQSIWVSSVANAEINSAVTQYARAQWSLTPNFISAQKQFGDITNRYAPPSSLGSDRWAAALAAADALPQQAAVIVDVGTAVTVDFVDGNGDFHGGIIFPGLYAMQTLLNTQAADINVDIRGDGDFAVADNTAAAVSNGALFAVAGGINFAVQQHQQTQPDCADCAVLITGGDAEKIMPTLNSTTHIHPDPQLVLRGLAVIAREMK